MANSVSTARARVIIIDGATPALTNMMKGMDAYNSRLASMDANLKKVSDNTGTYLSTLTKISGAYKAIGTLYNAANSLFSGTFEYYKSFQTNAVGISGILSSMVTLNGKTIEWNESMNISKEIMTKLRVQALQTAATSEDLIETFRALLGPGLASKMSIDEIMRFTTVGVNAVKSLGLPTNQLIQELRDLVQGGIRAASSTLATALGLDDAQINAAKQSSEGLFKFLMKRMEGFQKSTGETANTIYGQMEIFKEAFKSAGASAGENLFEGIGEALKKVNEILLKRDEFTGLLEVNPEIVETVEVFAKTIGEAAKFAVDFGEHFGNSFKTITVSLSAMFVVPKIVETIGNGFMKVTGAVSALKSISRDYDAEFMARVPQKLKDLDAEITANENLVKVTNQLKAEQKALDKKYQGKNPFGTKFVEDAIKAYRNLGFSEQQAKEKLVEFVKAMNGSDNIAKNHASAVMSRVLQLDQERQALEKNISLYDKFGNAFKGLAGLMSKFSGTLSSLAFAFMACTDANDKFAQDLTKGLFAVDAGITAIGALTDTVKTCTEWWNTLDAAVKLTVSRIALAAGVIAVVSAVAYSASKGGGSTNTEIGDGNDIEDFRNPDGTFKSNKEILQSAGISNEIIGDVEKQGQLARLKQMAEEAKKNLDDDNHAGTVGITPKFTAPGKEKSNAQKAADQLEQVLKKYESLNDKLNVDIRKSNLMYSSLDEKNAEILKQENAWTEEIKAMAEKGVDANKIKELTALKNEAIKQREIAAQRDFNKKMNQLNLEAAQNTMLLGGTQADQYSNVNNALQAQLAYYDGLLQIEGLANDRRIELEKDRAAVIKQIRDNDMLNYKTAWEATLEEMATQQVNYGETIKSVFSTIESAGVNLLTSTESFGKRLTTFFKDIASSIMAEMAKIIIKGLITQAILGALGMMKKTPALTGMTSTERVMNSLYDKGYERDIPKYRANGGYASGWTVVGERGPELVNFSNPGRVYTAEQTRNVLGGGSAVNIKIDLRNESGQQLEAQETGSSFDGENYVIGVLLKAISTNKNGIRTIMKGVATT